MSCLCLDSLDLASGLILVALVARLLVLPHLLGGQTILRAPSERLMPPPGIYPREAVVAVAFRARAPRSS